MNTLIYNQINKMTEEKKPVTRNGAQTLLTITHVNQNFRKYLKQLDRDVLTDFSESSFFKTLDETVQFAIKKELRYR